MLRDGCITEHGILPVGVSLGVGLRSPLVDGLVHVQEAGRAGVDWRAVFGGSLIILRILQQGRTVLQVLVRTEQVELPPGALHTRVTVVINV